MTKNNYYIFATLFTVFAVTLSANLEVPLFRIYALHASRGTGVTALAFAVYVGGMIPVLIFLGGLSDIWGRRNVLLLAQFFVLISETLITFFPTLDTLFFTRFFAGMGVAFTISTATAFLNQIYVHAHQEKIIATWVGAASTLGFGIGPFLTGYAVLQNEMDLSPLSYKIAIAFVCFSLINSASLPNLKYIGNTKIIRIPYFPQGVWIYNLSIFSCWSTTAFTIAIMPTQLAHLHLIGHTGNVVSITLMSGFISIYAMSKLSEKTSIYASYILPILGILLLMLGLYTQQIVYCIIGGSVTGIASWGLMYKTGMTAVSKLSGQNKARGMSGFILMGYLGFAIPAIFIGYLVDQMGFFYSLYSYLICLMVLNTTLFFFYKKQHAKNLHPIQSITT